MTTVVNVTVKNGFCCGCGVCAGICPQKNLEMKWNIYGEYNPSQIHDCKTECGLCLSVCPFVDGNDDEDIIGKNFYGSLPDIHHRSEVGYYLDAKVGWVSNDEHRISSTSGGLATWFLEELLKQDIVDAVICVHHADSNDKLFQFVVSTTPEDVRKSSGSAYYPVELSEVIHFIAKHPKRYAVIGLPCVIKAVRLAQKKIAYLRERIVIAVGLCCSNLKSTYFTEYAAIASGHSNPCYVSYRQKSNTTTPKFYWFRFRFRDGINTELDWRPELWRMYMSRCFTLSACECCDDMFAECADVTFMDAWLPQYSKREAKGTSICLIRSEIAKNVLDSDGLVLKSIPIKWVIASQTSLHWKRDLLSYRLSLMEKEGAYHPKKRVLAGKGHALCFEREEVRKAMVIQHESRLWGASRFDEIGEWFSREYGNCSWICKFARKFSVGWVCWMFKYLVK